MFWGVLGWIFLVGSVFALWAGKSDIIICTAYFLAFFSFAVHEILGKMEE